MSDAPSDVFDGKQYNECSFQAKPETTRDGVERRDSLQHSHNRREGDEEGGEDVDEERCLR